MPDANPFPHFRLNFEQQKKRAKELLKAARSGEPSALARMRGTPLQLSSAQQVLAAELRFRSWAALKQHIAGMDSERKALARQSRALDADCPTMHIRCGNDIQHRLTESGFHGDFNLHINPYCQGPVTDAPDYLEQRARFIVESAGRHMPLSYEEVLQGCRDEEQRLNSAISDYERVVFWMEHDGYDQFALMRCLAWFAEHGAPALTELVSLNDYPGSIRFLGLGQLPPESLRLLWSKRQRLGREHLELARQAWHAFRQPDPTGLCVLAARSDLPLPWLAGALTRHLQELPSVNNGLGLTQQLLLQIISEEAQIEMRRLMGLLIYQRDPLPTLGDTGYDHILEQMARAETALFIRHRQENTRHWLHDRFSITAAGRSVLAGDTDWMKLKPPPRWVGGIHIESTSKHWRLNDRGQPRQTQPAEK